MTKLRELSGHPTKPVRHRDRQEWRELLETDL